LLVLSLATHLLLGIHVMKTTYASGFAAFFTTLLAHRRELVV
jgi:hypothetical protein